jgi:hypothetical protein
MLTRCGRRASLMDGEAACVVVTNVKDDVYLDGSGQLRTLIENVSKHYDRNAQAITPVQQNIGEVYGTHPDPKRLALPEHGDAKRSRDMIHAALKES